jgi:hypothetical protein
MEQESLVGNNSYVQHDTIDVYEVYEYVASRENDGNREMTLTMTRRALKMKDFLMTSQVV